MVLIEHIKPNFDVVLKDYEHTVSIIKKTNIYYVLEYKFSGWSLFVYIELMDSFFTFKIKVEKDGKHYEISDLKRSEDFYYRDNKVEYKSIFSFSDFSEDEFRLKRDMLVKNRSKLFVWKRSINSLAQLYANLVLSAIDNILVWSKE